MTNMRGKTAFVTGGSGGLGKEFGKQLAAQGAHVTIFARRQDLLEEARIEIMAARLDPSQEVNIVSLDAADAQQVVTAFRSQPRIPDVLYCNAGNTSNIGFFEDLDPAAFDECMKGNYYTAVYTAHAIIKIWLEDDRKSQPSSPTKLRQIVFINSAAALFPFPGYAAYSTSKCAVRALADTLRMEALRYSSPISKYTVHCTFPSSIITPAFFKEQTIKPELTKQIESSAGPIDELVKRTPSAETAVRQIIEGVKRGDFGIADDCFDSNLMYAVSLGISPKRGLGIFDTIVGILSTLFVWPIYRYYFDSLTKKHSIWKTEK